MQFEGIKDEKMEIESAIKFVYKSLVEKGYNPIHQIIGYLLSGDSSYITNYNNARTIIKKFERDEILEEILISYLKN
ncbi:MAG: IreB family regulatory phosphoprotein [Clostridioides sp.]|nr:IreB family regulatory phosphoprotein [Clostridioides sp.]